MKTWHGRQPRRSSHHEMSLQSFIVCACFAYIVGIAFFSAIYFYFISDFQQQNFWNSTLIVRGKPVSEFYALESLYFSAITMCTIGYGDIVPLGWYKWVAVVEGFLGYLAPTVFVALGLSILLNSHNERNRYIREQQRKLLDLVVEGWEFSAVYHDRQLQRSLVCMHRQNGESHTVELDSCCLQFHAWRNGYISTQEARALAKIECWLLKKQ